MKSLVRNRFKKTHRTRDGRRAQRRCNLCSGGFHPGTVFDRYCPTCREQNELLKFSEWLPDLDAAIQEKLIA